MSHHLRLTVALFALIAASSIGGCSNIRDMIVSEKSDALLEEFNSLSDCERVDFVQPFLTRGQQHDTFLETQWPPNAVMLTMLMDISERTGISRAIMISCWTGFSYGGDQIWLSLLEPWRAALGCDGFTQSRDQILRMCDPELATLIDTVLHSITRPSPADPLPRIHASEFTWWSIPAFLEDVRAMTTASGIEWTEEAMHGSGHVACDGVLPRDADPEYYIYFGRISAKRYLVKIMRRAEYDTAVKAAAVGHARWQTMPEYMPAGVVSIFEIQADGIRQIFTTVHR